MSPVRAVDPANGGTARLQSTRWNVIVAVRRNASGISELRCTLATRGSGAGERGRDLGPAMLDLFKRFHQNIDARTGAPHPLRLGA